MRNTHVNDICVNNYLTNDAYILQMSARSHNVCNITRRLDSDVKDGIAYIAGIYKVDTEVVAIVPLVINSC